MQICGDKHIVWEEITDCFPNYVPRCTCVIRNNNTVSIHMKVNFVNQCQLKPNLQIVYILVAHIEYADDLSTLMNLISINCEKMPLFNVHMYCMYLTCGYPDSPTVPCIPSTSYLKARDMFSVILADNFIGA